MNKKHHFYREVFRRKNLIKDFLLPLFLSIASYPRMILEVFIRKNFGERYFSFATAITVFTILLILPFAFSFNYYGMYQPDLWSVLKENKLWYSFCIFFLYISYQRKEEIKRLPSVFDFSRFSLYGGDIHPFLIDLIYKQKAFTIRQAEIFIEPLFFFLIGLALSIIGQAPLGILIIICSLLYSLSYSGAYYLGDNFIMDKIDEMICSEELVNTFVSDLPPSETRGFHVFGRKPASEDKRRKVYEHMTSEDEDEAKVL